MKLAIKTITICLFILFYTNSYSQNNNLTMSEKAINTVTEYYQNLDTYKGDISKMNTTFNENMKFYFVGTPTGFSSSDFLEISKAYYLSFPDLKHSIKEIFFNNGLLACRVIAQGTHKGVFQGVEATNKTISVEAIVIFEIENNKLSVQRTSADMLGLMLNIGVVKM